MNVTNLSEIKELFKNAVNFYDIELENSDPNITEIIQKFLEIETKIPTNHYEKKIIINCRYYMGL